MRTNIDSGVQDRRGFLVSASAVAIAGATLANTAIAAPALKMRGIYPIAQTPCTPDNKLDIASLAGQVRFCTKARVPGVVWPQLASGWITLSEDERMAGAEAMLAAARGTSTHVVIGVQARDGDVKASARLAKHAAAHGAPAVIALCSLPKEKASDGAIVDYFQAIGAATPLPFVMQATGNMSPELIGEVYKRTPTLACIKDEAGDPLANAGAIRSLTGGKVSLFAGRGARTLLDEMRLGFDGNCPAFGLCDLLQQTYDLWHAGKRSESFDLFGRYLAFMSIPGADPYVLITRGIFPQNARIREMPNSKNKIDDLSPSDKSFITTAYKEFLAPYQRV